MTRQEEVEREGEARKGHRDRGREARRRYESGMGPRSPRGASSHSGGASSHNFSRALGLYVLTTMWLWEAFSMVVGMQRMVNDAASLFHLQSTDTALTSRINIFLQLRLQGASRADGLGGAMAVIRLNMVGHVSINIDSEAGCRGRKQRSLIGSVGQSGGRAAEW